MANSRKPRSTADPLERALFTAVQSAVARSLPQPAGGPRQRLAPAAPLMVAYSGGRDSTALLHLVARLRDSQEPHFGQPLALHVHHGLHPDADAWAEHCQRQCEALKVPCTVWRVQVRRGGLGLEAAAREARYAALADAARQAGAAVVLTAHHLDDRLETFLLQWIRGAGPDGLTAMEGQRSLGEEGSPVALLRPLLHTPREWLERYIERHALPFIEDPSNADTRIDRNLIRLRVMPELAGLRTGFRAAAERSIELIAEAAEVARSVARQDLETCTRDAASGTLRIDRLALLPPARQAPVLREWVAQAGLRPPSRARLREAIDQALHAASDARVLVHRRARVAPASWAAVPGLASASTGHRACLAMAWGGEPAGATVGWNAGVPSNRRRRVRCRMAARGAAAPAAPHRRRALQTPSDPAVQAPKQLFQEARIPEYERAGLPLIWRDGRLIFVAGIGADARMLVADGDRVRIEWIGAARLLRD